MSSSQNKLQLSSGILHTSIKILQNFKKVVKLQEILDLHKIFISEVQYSLIFLENCEYIKHISTNDYIILKSLEPIDYKNQLKELLYNYIIYYKPLWTERIKWGLSSFIKDMTLNESHCFQEVSLLDFENIENIFWWNKLPFYENENLSQRKVGAIGEFLTLKYEKKRSESTPIHISLLGSYHGYDILSLDNKYSNNKKLIECKATTSIKDIIINITRNEWDTALLNAQNYYFHIWKLDIQKRRAILYEITTDELSIHIPNPSNSTYGYFTNANVNLTKILKDKNTTIEYDNLLFFEYLLQ